MKNSILFLIVVIGLGMASSEALAERFFVEDQTNKFSVSYPDTWHKTSNQKSDEKFHIIAPGEGHQATCRMRVRDDKRFGMYPRKYAGSIQKVAYSSGFWESYLGEYNNAQILTLDEPAGIGPGHASYVEAAFVETTGPRIYKRGLMAVTNVNNKVYVFECSAASEHYDAFHAKFLNILSTVKIAQVSTANVTGHYRNFMCDRRLKINGRREIDAYIY